VLTGIGAYLVWQQGDGSTQRKGSAVTARESIKPSSGKRLPGLPFIEKYEPVESEAEFKRVVKRINRLQARAVGFLKEENYHKVVPIYEEVLQTVISKFGKDHTAVPGAMNDLAFVLVKQAKLKRAEIIYLEAIKACHATGNKEDLQVAVASEELARIYLKQGRPEQRFGKYHQPGSEKETGSPSGKARAEKGSGPVKEGDPERTQKA